MNSPSHITELVSPDLPHVYGAVDASAQGMGGVILPATRWIQPTVWRLEMTPHLRKQVEDGQLTIADCEFVAWFLQECLLDEILTAEGTTAGVSSHTWSDNSPTVGWADRQASNAQSTTPNRAIRWMAIRQRYFRRGPREVTHWEGASNLMADFCSRSFDAGYPSAGGEPPFLREFTHRFPLPRPQLGSWRQLVVRREIASAAFWLLRQTPDTETPVTVRVGDYGVHLPRTLATTLTSEPCRTLPSTWNEATCSWPLLLPSGKESSRAGDDLRGRKSKKYYSFAEPPWSPRDYATLGVQIQDR